MLTTMHLFILGWHGMFEGTVSFSGKDFDFRFGLHERFTMGRSDGCEGLSAHSSAQSSGTLSCHWQNLEILSKNEQHKKILCFH